MRYEQLTHHEGAIVDNVRNIVADAIEKVGLDKLSVVEREIGVELEQIYQLLDSALQDMTYAQNQGQVRVAVEQARDQIYRLLR